MGRRKNRRIHLGTVTQEEVLRAMRRADREAEIALHGHPVSSRRVLHSSKKVYSRKRLKRTPIDES